MAQSLARPSWLYAIQVESSNYSEVNSESNEDQVPATSRVSCSEMDLSDIQPLNHRLVHPLMGTAPLHTVLLLTRIDEALFPERPINTLSFLLINHIYLKKFLNFTIVIFQLRHSYSIGRSGSLSL